MDWIDRCMAWQAACIAAGLAGGMFALDAGFAQTPPARPSPKSEPPAVSRVTPVGQQVTMPEANKIVLLLRSTLLTLNDALQTGNYTVLRDMGAPGFREANTAARLTQIFAPLAAQGADLTVAAILAPQLTEVPAIDPQRQMLRLKGFFPGQPQQINFEVLYEPIAGRWRLFGISVALAQAEPQARAPEPPADSQAAARPGIAKAKASPQKAN